MIYCYGNASSICNTLSIAKEYSRKFKLKVVLFDYPGYGISKGTPSEESTIEALRKIIMIHKKSYLVGESLGTGVVLSYARKYENEFIESITLISPFTSLISVATKHFLLEMLYDAIGDSFYKNYDNIRFVPSSTPITIISLKSDDVVPNSHGKELSEICSHSKFIEIKSRNNNHGNFSYSCLKYVTF